MSQKSLTTFHKRRAILVKRLNLAKSRLEEAIHRDSYQHHLLKEDLNEYERIYQEFDHVQREIEFRSEDSEIDSELEYRSNIEEGYKAVLAEAKQFLIKPNQETERPGQPELSNIKLPTIRIPNFDGSYEDWLEFRDTFDSLIHKNKTISNMQKFHYLRASLKGSALSVISALEFTSTNYEIAWQTINNRYNNENLLAAGHISSLLDMQPLHKPTSNGIKDLVDGVTKHLRALSALGEPVESWDTLIIHIVCRKLGFSVNKEWEQCKIGKPKPSLDDFKQFLVSQSTMLQSLEHRSDAQKPARGQKPALKGLVVSNANSYGCIICHEGHRIFECSKFRAATPKERLKRIQQLNLCVNCLKPGHKAENCQSSNCRKCNRKHNSLLHLEASVTSNSNVQSAVSSNSSHNESNEAVPSTSSAAANCSHATVNGQVLLPTVLLHVFDSCNMPIVARALLDTGAQCSFVTAELVRKLGLEPKTTQLQVSGLGAAKSNVSGSVTVTAGSRYSSYTTSVTCLIVPRITGTLPAFAIATRGADMPKVQLADPTFNKPGPIDLLIGSDVFWRIIQPGIHRQKGSTISLQRTVFGWVVAGPVNASHPAPIQCHHAKVADIQDQLKKFWEIEELNSSEIRMSPDELACEANFLQTTTRDSSGRFIVSIPFKHDPCLLGESFEAAKRQFFSLERRLARTPSMKECYSQFMKEYLQLGHMKEVSPTEARQQGTYYMPHHGVYREHSLTTKLRVVFNASMPTTSGYSLNDLMLIGPVIQDDLFSILLRFRKHQIAVAADIQKMYRQVKMNPDHTCYQQILWRENEQEDLKTYRLQTVTYGTAAGSFLSTRCLQQLSIENQELFPEAARILREDFYVDDMLTGADDVESVLKVIREISSILNTGGFPLQKWKSNDSEINRSLLGETSSDVTCIARKDKTLGLFWATKEDSLMLSAPPVQCLKNGATKRLILATASKIFDPLGLLAPSTICAKILLQKLWLAKTSWDERVPHDIQALWEQYTKGLPELNSLSIPRKVIDVNSREIQIHGFCDASEAAYGCCIYLRSDDLRHRASVNLVCAKSRVAPLKPLTVPKLELCAALLLARLTHKVKKAMRIETTPCTLWSDSTVVLGWLKLPPNQLKTFVSNRVAEIQDLTETCQWRHIPSASNPADILSRGISPGKLQTTHIWWHGPEFLSGAEETWPPSYPLADQQLPERRGVIAALLGRRKSAFDFDRFSSFTRLKRTAAYILRFKDNCLSSEKIQGHLTVAEINRAFISLLKIVQKEYYSCEIEALQQGRCLPTTSKLLKLTPFLDQDEVLRVGGRLKNSNYEFDKIHPILLPVEHHMTKLIFRFEHLAMYHAGPSSILASTRERIWVPAGRKLAKSVVRNCLQCIRYKAPPNNQIMGNLPSSRITPGFPFDVVGVDYAGPYNLRHHRGKGSRTDKAWICLFICFKTRAVHIELVTSLSCEHFLAALRRFVARRGKPSHIYSDNGTNFAGAQRELKDLLKNQNFQLNIKERAATDDIVWHFIPPRSPHMGGLWERAIKSCKHHLRRVIGNQHFTCEEFRTILTQIESILNSRPLTPLSSDPNDLHALTPYHFLIGRSINSLPDPDVTHIPINRLSRFQLLQSLQQHFWNRWRKEYLAELQQRVKWTTSRQGIQIGDLVLLKEDNLPPKSWKLGRIVAILPGRDNIARVADIRVSNGIVRRNITSLCPIPIQDTSSKV